MAKKSKKNIEDHHWGEEPTWEGLTEEQANSKYAFALNWYNYMASDSEKKKWVLEYAKKKKMKEEVIRKLTSLDPKKFSIGYNEVSEDDLGMDTGIYARLICQGAPVPKERELKLKKCLVHLVSSKSADDSGASHDSPNIQDHIRNKAAGILADILNVEERMIHSHFKESGGDAIDIVKREETKGIHCKYIKDELSKTLNEIELSAKDKELKEAYSSYSKQELKKYVAWLKEVINECELKMMNVSRTRKPRKKKVKSAEQIARKAQIQESFSELGLKSMPASSIVNSCCVVLYNTHTRELQMIQSFPGQELTIKGTTILNFDPSKSVKKKVRKPEVIKSNFSKKLPITKVKALIENIKTKSSSPNGRLNKYTMILSAF